jgi:5-methylcytosine-specific restriction endonuclease McrBC regulatory subunit McrC
MGPPTKRRSRNWSSQLGFLFFSILFLTLSIQRNKVNAEFDDLNAALFDPSSTLAPNTSSTQFGLNITGKRANESLFRRLHYSAILEVFPLTHQHFLAAKTRKRNKNDLWNSIHYWEIV